MQLVKHAVVLSLSVLTTGPYALAADCHPKFGDQIYRWVDETAERQSWELARADYYARTFNYFLLSFDDLHLRTASLQADLDAISDAIAKAESSPETDEIRIAVDRDASTTTLLNSLFATRAKLDLINLRLADLAVTPTEASFDVDGLGNVGRATLLSSLIDLGASAEKSMAARYSVYVSITMDEEGNSQGAPRVERSADMADTVMFALALTGNPYAIGAFVLFEGIRNIVAEEECSGRVKKQTEIMRRAFALLPDRLISHSAQYALYQEAYATQIKRFSEVSSKLMAMLEQSDRRWRQLFAFNAARAATANAVLTPAKLAALEEEFRTVGDLHDIVSNVAISRFAERFADMNSFLASEQIALLTACRNVPGVRSMEDQRDALSFALASLDVFKGAAALIPLQPLIERSRLQAQSQLEELETLSSALSLRTCTADPMDGGTAVPLVKEGVRGIYRATVDGPWRSQVLARSGGSFCALVRNGDVYVCDQPGAGQSYGSEFNSDLGNPREEVLRGGNDGGYAEDNRRISEDIEAATANIDSRIAETNAKAMSAQSALKEWTLENGSALDLRLNEAIASTDADAGAAAAFQAGNAAVLSSAKAMLDEFLSAPADKARVTELTREVGATDLSLPDLADSQIPADIPLLPGVTAQGRVFDSNATPEERTLARERTKLAGAAGLSEAQRELSATALGLADQFQGADAATNLTDALIEDSAAIRYVASGEMKRLDLTFVDDDGNISRGPVDDIAHLPAETLISQALRFNDASLSFSTRARTLHDLIDENGTDLQKRSLGFADRLAAQASSVFYSGQTVDGLMLMTLATVTLDLVTSLTPGVSWGRDIYESVTGRNLITGEELTTIERTLAIAGAVSGGVAAGGPKVLRAMQKVADLGQSGKDFKRLNETAAHIDQEAVEWSVHAGDKLNHPDMIEAGLDEEHVNNALNGGTRFIDRDKNNTIVSFENFDRKVEGDRMRAAAAIDPLSGDLQRGEKVKLVTVYPERRVDSELSKAPSEEFPGLRRFIRIDPD
ncbi:pre-toxin TG domain-containing protein (plasmid) [Sinorhizobium meliloti]